MIAPIARVQTEIRINHRVEPEVLAETVELDQVAGDEYELVIGDGAITATLDQFGALGTALAEAVADERAACHFTENAKTVPVGDRL